MKYRDILLEQVKNLPYFDRSVLAGLGLQYGIKKRTIDAYIARSLARIDLIQLKKGVYASADFYEKNRRAASYRFYVANILRAPSYVSSWTALQYYNLTTDAIQSTISVTPKTTCAFRNKAGVFTYHSIKEDLFSGFSLVKGPFDFFIASPAKALFDLLYFKTKQMRGLNAGMIAGFVEELRIDMSEMSPGERDKFSSLVEDFLAHHE